MPSPVRRREATLCQVHSFHGRCLLAMHAASQLLDRGNFKPFCRCAFLRISFCSGTFRLSIRGLSVPVPTDVACNLFPVSAVHVRVPAQMHANSKSAPPQTADHFLNIPVCNSCSLGNCGHASCTIRNAPMSQERPKGCFTLHRPIP